MNSPPDPAAAADARGPFSPAVLAIDPAAEIARIADWLRTAIARDLHRRGAVVAVSGGVDSAVCASLAVAALGRDRVQALFLPGRNTDAASAARARELCHALGVELAEQPIAPALAELGCYRARDAAIHAVFPAWRPADRYKIVLAGDLLAGDRASLFDLVVERPDGTLARARLPLDAYLRLVAATNMKQRIRKLLEYQAAEARNYAVIGTPNRLEYELGFFVRGGDGLADCKPIAHLYKTQVYALAERLGVPAAIRAAPPSTETYSLPQTQQEFFFALPYGLLDLLLWAARHGVPAAVAAPVLGLSPEQVERVFGDLAQKRRAAQRLHRPALLVEEVP